MTYLKKLQVAMAEAKRFLKKAATLEEKLQPSQGTYWGNKESGAVRRASMDLTRALAELRKP